MHREPGVWPLSPRWWQVLLAGLLLAVAWLALSPQPPKSMDTGWDKANHVLAFAALALCARGAAVGSRCPLPGWLGVLLVYGAAIELVQTQVPGRAGEWADLLADALGVLLGGLLGRWMPRRR